MTTMFRLLFPVPWSDEGIGHTTVSIGRALNAGAARAELICPKRRPGFRDPIVRAVLPKPLRVVPHRLITEAVQKRLERAYLDRLDDGDIAYLFSYNTPALAEALRTRGVPVIREKFNCHTGAAQRILSDAYDRLGMDPATHGITDDSVAREHEGLSTSDIVSSPSPMVTKSLIDMGIDAERVVETAYGWEPKRFREPRPLLEPIDGATFLFVGLSCVRKGTHLLLEAWEQANIKGRLVLCGQVEPMIRQRWGHILERDDVLCTGHIDDVASAYRSADVFMLPTLEEGCPLVTLEAMSQGVPSIVSTMGAGPMVRHEHEGLIVEPFASESIISAMRRLALNDDDRRAMGDSAAERAQDFTWERTGARRRDLLLEKLSILAPHAITMTGESKRAA